MLRRGGGGCSFPEMRKEGDKVKEDEQMGGIEEEKIKGIRQERKIDGWRRESRREASKDMARYEERRQQVGGGKDSEV